MIDGKKVMEGLSKIRNEIVDGYIKEPERAVNTLTDALVLLKTQEAKPMTEYDDGWDCPRCGLKLIEKTASGYPCDKFDLPNDEIVKYCPVCGQAVKWE